MPNWNESFILEGTMLTFLKQNKWDILTFFLILCVAFLSSIKGNYQCIIQNKFLSIINLLTIFLVFIGSFFCLYYFIMKANMSHKILNIFAMEEIRMFVTLLVSVTIWSYIPFPNIYIGYFIFGSALGSLFSILMKGIKWEGTKDK